MNLNLKDITHQESGIVVYNNREAIICNWANTGDGLPRLFNDMLLLAFPADVEITDHGTADNFGEFDSKSWEFIYDANGDAPNLNTSASCWRWWKLNVTGVDADVLVIAPSGWN